jgi:hypothetical protein
VNSFVIAGLPVHILLVHAVVILAPLTGVAVILHALWPAARRRLGFVTPLAALVVLVLVPITVSAGEALEATVGSTPAIEKHADLGDTLLPWAIALFVVAVVEWVWYRFVHPMANRMPRAARIASAALIAVAAVVIGVGSIIDVVLIGDAGARAVWGGLFGG